MATLDNIEETLSRSRARTSGVVQENQKARIPVPGNDYSKLNGTTLKMPGGSRKIKKT